MKYAWKFDVINRPSKEKDGVTNVSQDFSISSGDAGDVVPVGSIVKSRGNASYVALDLNDARVGVYTTRSQAAHALRKHRVANLTPVDAAAEATADAAAEATAEVAVDAETETVTIEAADVEETSTDDLGGEAA